MAQTSTHPSPPAGGTTNRIYLDNQIILQLGASEEHPEGEVRVLKAGWNEIPPELQDHPVLRRLRPESESEGQRRQQVLDAERERDEALSKVQAEYAEKVNEAEKARSEEIRQRAEERAKRMEETARRGEVSYEPNPDPDAAHAEALTLSPNMHIVSAAGMAYKGDETVAAGQRRVMEGDRNPNLGGQSPQGGSGYSRQDAAHRTTSPVADSSVTPQGTNKDEVTGVNNPSGTSGGSSSSSPGSSTPPGRTRG